MKTKGTIRKVTDSLGLRNLLIIVLSIALLGAAIGFLEILFIILSIRSWSLGEKWM